MAGGAGALEPLRHRRYDPGVTWLLGAVLLLIPIPGTEDPVAATLTVKGMTRPELCGVAVTRRLEGAAGVVSATLLDFKAGLFSLKFDPKLAIDPGALQKAAGPYEIARIEATLTGRLSIEEDKLFLQTASGMKCHLNGHCSEKGADPSEKACAEVEAQLRAWLAGKTPAVRITGELRESCCEGEQLLSTLRAEPVRAR
jgi:hypothetical protein